MCTWPVDKCFSWILLFYLQAGCCPILFRMRGKKLFQIKQTSNRIEILCNKYTYW